MSEELYKNIDCMFFEPLLKGELRSFLPRFDDPVELKKINCPVFSYKLTLDSILIWWKNFKIPLKDTMVYCIEKCSQVRLNIDPINQTIILKLFNGKKCRTHRYAVNFNYFKNWWLYISVPTKIVNEYCLSESEQVELTYDIKKNNVTFELIKNYSVTDYKYKPRYLFEGTSKDEFKAYSFLDYLNRKIIKMESSGQKVILNISDTNSLALYAQRNLSQLKIFANEAKMLYLNIEKRNKLTLYQDIIYGIDHELIYSDSCDDEYHEPDLFVAHAIREYILDAIIFYYNNFQNYLPNACIVPRKELCNQLYDIVKPEEAIRLEEAKAMYPEFFDINQIFKYIEGGLFEYKYYMLGKIARVYQYNLLWAFEKLRDELYKAENYTKDNIALCITNLKKVDELVILYDEWSSKRGVRKIPEGRIFPDYTCDELVDYITGIRFLYNDFLEINDDIQQTIDNSKKSNNGKLPVSFTYKHIAKNPEAIKTVYEKLVDNGYLSGNYLDFKKIFSGKAPENKLIWNTNPTDLSYFIDLIHNKLKVVEDLKQKHFKVTAMCFIIAGLNDFNFRKLRLSGIPASKSAKILKEIAGKFILDS